MTPPSVHVSSTCSAPLGAPGARDDSPGAHDDQATQLRELVASMAERAVAAPSVGGVDAQALRLSRAAPAPVRRVAAPLEQARTGHARVLAVASGKGGVGKTNLSVGLSAALASMGHKTLLLDGDLGLANADVLCGVSVGSHLGHVLGGSRRIEEVLIDAPGGFQLAPGGAGIAQLVNAGPLRRAELVRRLTALERGFDVVVIDCGAGIGGAVMSFVRAADVAAIVTTPEPTAVTDAYALIKCIASLPAEGGAALSPSSIALIVNQATDEDEAVRTWRRISAVCERFLGFGPSMAGWVALDGHVPEAVRARRPFVVAHPKCRAARNVRTVATDLSARLRLSQPCRRQRVGFVGRLFQLGVR